MPALKIAAIALLMAAEKDPPRDMFMTAFPVSVLLATSSMTNCMPLRTPELLPPPLASRTLTATRLAFLATPKVAPAMVPETWLP